jgi:hypothetical protein
VHTGYEWNKYNQTHYDHDNPPPKIVQGYKFNIFYPDLVDKSKAPVYTIEKDGSAGETCHIRFHAGPPYEDIVSLLPSPFQFSCSLIEIPLTLVFLGSLFVLSTRSGSTPIRRDSSAHLSVGFFTCISTSRDTATGDRWHTKERIGALGYLKLVPCFLMDSVCIQARTDMILKSEYPSSS